MNINTPTAGINRPHTELETKYCRKSLGYSKKAITFIRIKEMNHVLKTSVFKTRARK